MDGGYHDIKEQREKDLARTIHLKEVLIDEIRFKNEEILGDLDDVLKRILERI